MGREDVALDLWGIQYRRRALRAAGLLVALWLAFDLHSQPTPLVLGLRTLWAASLLGASFLQRPERPRLALRATMLATLVSAAASVAVVAVRQDNRPVGLGLLLAMPLIGLAVTPQLTVTPLLASAITVPGGAVALLDMGQPPTVVAEWVILAAASAAATVCCTRVNLRAAGRAIGAEHERVRAVEGLAESERRRALSERLAIVGRLTTGVAHEVNNPLSYVRSNLQWISTHHCPPGEDGEEMRSVLRDSLAGIDRIAHIVADLRSFAGHRSEAQAPCRVEEALQEAERMASVRLAGVRLERAIQPGLPPLRMLDGRVVQALVNLLANAADAVARRDPEARWIRVAAVREGAAVRVDVDDGGPGLAPQVRARLFEPFVTTKGSDGTGLGLYLTREFLGRHGGSIEAGQAPGGGARFTLRIPAEPDGELPEETPAPRRAGGAEPVAGEMA